MAANKLIEINAKIYIGKTGRMSDIFYWHGFQKDFLSDQM